MSHRGEEWIDFSEKVLNHIENYCVPQYGDAPNDSVAKWTCDDCVTSIKKYASRHGSNSREGQDELDLLKIAHYACLALLKYEEKKNQGEKHYTLTKSQNGETILFTEDAFYINMFPLNSIGENVKKITIEVKDGDV